MTLMMRFPISILSQTGLIAASLVVMKTMSASSATLSVLRPRHRKVWQFVVSAKCGAPDGVMRLRRFRRLGRWRKRKRSRRARRR